MNIQLQQGAIVLVRFPFTDHKSSKVRPAVIVSGKIFNRGRDLVLAPITTQPAHSPFTLLLSQSDLENGHLQKKSSIKCGNLTTFDRILIQQTVAQLKPLTLKAILKLSRSTLA